jgi:hypothetical protein
MMELALPIVPTTDTDSAYNVECFTNKKIGMEGHFESGKNFPSKKSTPSWSLHYEADGLRTHTEKINFQKRFDSAPTIFVALSAQDVETNADLRLSVTTSNADQNGFSLNFNCWKDTAVWGACASWIAWDDNFAKDLKGFYKLLIRLINQSSRFYKKKNPNWPLFNEKNKSWLWSVQRKWRP